MGAPLGTFVFVYLIAQNVTIFLQSKVFRNHKQTQTAELNECINALN